MKVMIDGVETEVFSAEEIQSQAERKAKEIADVRIAEEREKFEAEKLVAEDLAKEKENALKEAEDKLKKAEEKELNFKNLREKNKGTDDDREKTQREIADLRKTVAEIQTQPLKAAKDQFISSNNITGDKDLNDKFEYFYNMYGKNAKTMEEVNSALIASHAAATGGRSQPNFADQNITRTSVNDNFGGFQDSKQESEASQQFGAMLGLSAEDKKRFGGALKTGSVPIFANTSSEFNKK